VVCDYFAGVGHKTGRWETFDRVFGESILSQFSCSFFKYKKKPAKHNFNITGQIYQPCGVSDFFKNRISRNLHKRNFPLVPTTRSFFEGQGSSLEIITGAWNPGENSFDVPFRRG